MKKERSLLQLIFVNCRTLFGFFLCLAGLLPGLFVLGGLAGGSAQAEGTNNARAQLAGKPDVVRMIGPAPQDLNLNDLPYIAPNPSFPHLRLHGLNANVQGNAETSSGWNWLLMPSLTPIPLIPAPSASFDGVNSTTSACGCLPPDTDGDVGPNHYLQSVNEGIEIFNKTTGAILNGFTTYNSFFSALGPTTPCGNSQNNGDGIAFYDQIADRWVVSDFAFPVFPGTSFYQCIGVSKTNDPVSGGWYLYALQVDPAHANYFGDYPKFGLWPDGYYLTMNEFSDSTTFNGVRVYALDRNSMLSGGSPNAIGFSISPATLNNGNTYSLLPATFRFGAPPPGAAEYLLAVDSTDNNTLNTAVYAWRLHADFTTPGNSTFGVGANHAPNATITVNGFYDAIENTGGNATTYEVPQLGTIRRLDTLGDKLMYPLYYQNLNGVESLWASQTVNTGSNASGFTNPTGIRWHQFNVTGGALPVGAAQQQTYTNNSDGLWRFMPSNALDVQGNYAIGYSVSSGTINPAIRYAGRLAGDPANSLAQGENALIQGAGHQTYMTPRWGDYSATVVDVSDSCTFYHTNEYYVTTSSASWSTRIGAFKFPTCTAPPPVQLSSVHSRLTHGSVADFDINMPLSGTRGVECRSSASLGSGSYTIIFAFSNILSNVAGATVSESGCGTIGVGSSSMSGSDYIVNLTGVCNAQYVTVTLANVNDSAGGHSDNVAGPQMGFLIGDVDASGRVDAADVSLVREQTLQPVNDNPGTSNFREDINSTGRIDSADTSFARQNALMSLPSPP